MTLRRHLLTPFLPRVLRCVNLIKVSNWFEADLQMFLIWWMKFSLLSIHVPESLTFDTALISFWSMFIIWLVCMISFVFIKYYRMKFICIHNHVVIFKVLCLYQILSHEIYLHSQSCGIFKVLCVYQILSHEIYLHSQSCGHL